MKFIVTFFTVLMLFSFALSSEIRFDFETGDMQGWRIVEGQFGRVISDRSQQHHDQKPYTKEGRFFMSTLENEDGTSPRDAFTGVIESPVITLQSAALSMKVGGGKGADVCLAVCTLDGKEVAYARGDNSQAMIVRNFELPELVGQSVFFRLVDKATGSWGHITLDELVCQGAVDTLATELRWRKLQSRGSSLHQTSAESMRSAIRELGVMYGTQYPAEKFLREIELAEQSGNSTAHDKAVSDALIKHNPLLNSAPILFTTRKQYRPDHHNTATLFQVGEINAHSYDTQGSLKKLDVVSGKVTTIFDPGQGATVRDSEISFDAEKIIFSMRRGADDNYHIYTVRSDGTELKQLTHAPDVSDIDPIWLPDGNIVFSGTREPKYCMCNRHIMCNLYRMEADGANIHQIGKSTLFEGHASLLPDGRILYDRWEYVDRNFGDAQGLWVCYPDGTGHAIYYGNNTTSPGGVIDARSLEEGNKVIAVLGSCHDRPWGALGIIDRSIGVDGAEPVLRTWPADFRSRISTEGQDFDSTKHLKIKYEDPWPLDDEHFLCARQTGRGEEMGVYYLDLHGNEILVHSEQPGCYDPMLLRPRVPPQIHALRRDFSDPQGSGSFYLQNVYIGTHMKNVKQGAIKYLRIVESPEKRSWAAKSWNGQGAQAPAMNWHSFENKRILGTVPVEADGSAYFEVPANTFLFFQALDEYKVMVQSMRSGIYVQPGENYGCVGCHENRVADIPHTGARPVALKRPPSKLTGWFGPPRRFSFQDEVQPVFNKHCVSCHDYGRPAGEKLNLAGDRDSIFCTSYVDLWTKGAIRCVGGGPAELQEAYSWGGSRSDLIRKVFTGHADVKLEAEELERLVTWVDLNAPYYPFYEFSGYGHNPGGRSPLTAKELEQLNRLTGQKISFNHRDRQHAMISFERPEKSRILQQLEVDSDAYRAALILIKSGAERLKVLPRADMPGFRPGAQHVEINQRYQRRLQFERDVYRAIREGRKLYDRTE